MHRLQIFTFVNVIRHSVEFQIVHPSITAFIHLLALNILKSNSRRLFFHQSFNIKGYEMGLVISQALSDLGEEPVAGERAPSPIRRSSPPR